MKSFASKFTAFVLIFAITLPSTVFAQTTNPDSLDYYFNQAQELNVAQGSKMNSIANSNGLLPKEKAELSGLVAALFTALIGFGTESYVMSPSRLSLYSLSDLEILNDPIRFDAYIKFRYQTIDAFNALMKTHNPTYAAIHTPKYNILVHQFKNLDLLFTTIEETIGFDKRDHRFDGITTSEKQFYSLFRRYGIEPTTTEVRQIIQALSMAEKPDQYFHELRYKNLIRALRSEKLGPIAIQEMVVHLHNDVFFDDHFRSFEHDYHANKTIYPKHTIAENVREAGITHNLYRGKDTTKALDQLILQNWGTQTKRHNRYGIKTLGAMFLIGFTVAAIVYYASNPGENEPSVQSKYNLTEEDILLMSESDHEGFVNLLKSDKILAATFAWLYHTLLKTQRELAEFDQLTAGK